jgi:signal transduction histidine kinase
VNEHSTSSFSEALVVTPNEIDAQLACKFLQDGGISAGACGNLRDLCSRLALGAGCVVIVEEALLDEEMPLLREALEAQPPWSDVPLVLVAREGAELSTMAERAFPNAGNITLLSRPLNPHTLLSAVEVGLRARHRQVQVRDLLAQREEALRKRDEFVAMLAHELRNPLAPMRNAVSLQKQLESDDAVFVKTRAIFDRQVTHLSRLVDDLLDIARLERGKVKLRLKRVDLNDAVRAACETCAPNTHGHDVVLELSPEALPLQADPVRLEQVLCNLLTNAAKFTPQGGGIVLATRKDGDVAEVSVSDTGIGIRPEDIDTMFNPFTQGDQSLDRPTGGLGIGLSIARRVADLHGGTLHARSDGPGKGATFVVRFPISTAAAPQAELPLQQSDEPAARPRSKRVLVVDDNPDIRDSLRMLLVTWGHEVTVAANGEEALDLALAIKPEVALVDIGLPGMNGYEVAQAIRRASAQWQSPIKMVAVTGYGQPSDRQRALESGFDGHMLKPVDTGQLEKVFN